MDVGFCPPSPCGVLGCSLGSLHGQRTGGCELQARPRARSASAGLCQRPHQAPDRPRAGAWGWGWGWGSSAHTAQRAWQRVTGSARAQAWLGWNPSDSGDRAAPSSSLRVSGQGQAEDGGWSVHTRCCGGSRAAGSMSLLGPWGGSGGGSAGALSSEKLETIPGSIFQLCMPPSGSTTRLSEAAAMSHGCLCICWYQSSLPTRTFWVLWVSPSRETTQLDHTAGQGPAGCLCRLPAPTPAPTNAPSNA